MCKKVLTFGKEGLSEADATVMLKRWLICGLGLEFCPYGRTARDKHKDVEPRIHCRTGIPSAELDSALASAYAQWHLKYRVPSDVQ
jgi:hypothetical protein